MPLNFPRFSLLLVIIVYKIYLVSFTFSSNYSCYLLISFSLLNRLSFLPMVASQESYEKICRIISYSIFLRSLCFLA